MTPRKWTAAPSTPNTGTSTHEWSGAKPVAQMTLATSTSRPSANATLEPLAPVGRPRVQVTPLRRARRGRSRQLVALLRPASEASIGRLRQRAYPTKPIEDVAAEEALWQRLLARAD